MAKTNRQDLGYLGEDFQYKLIQAFFEDKDFFKDLNNIIDQNMFTNPSLKTIVGVMKEYYEKEETVPSYTMMGIVLNEKAHNDIEKDMYQSILDKIRLTESDGVDYVRELATKFFKQQNIVKTANEILKIAGNGEVDKYERCVELLTDALHQGEKDNLGEAVFDDIGETLSDDYRTPIPTGIGKIDEALEGGLGKGEIGVIIGSSSFGKAQPLTSKILTPNGWKLMQDIHVGDDVVGRLGEVNKVIGVFPQGLRPIYKITFSNGATCECDIEHLWTVKENDDVEYKTITLHDIIQSELILSCDSKETVYRFQIPNVDTLYFNEKKTEIHPYLFGCQIALMKNINDEILNSIDAYIFNSEEVRIEFIRGLMHVNGVVGHTNNHCYYSSSIDMCKKIQDVIKSLGGYSELQNIQDAIDDVKWQLVFVLPQKIEQRLYARYSPQIENKIYIQSVEYVREDYAQCIMVDSDEHLYITDDFIVTHNTSMTTAMASYAATFKSQYNNNAGYKVLQIVFEDRIKQIQRKHLGRITGVEAKDLSKPDKIEYVKQQIAQYEDFDLLQNNLRIVRFPSGELTANGLKRFIKKMINSGFKPDLVIVDYFECLASDMNSNAANEYEKEGKTMRKLEAMAGELDIAIWIPTQGTKESVNLDLVTMDKAGGSFKKIQIAHIVISIARSMEDIENNKATIALLKNRAGKSGKVFNNVEFNNGTCRISTDNVDEFDNMIEYNKNAQKQRDELVSKVFAMTQAKKIKKNL